MSSGASERFDAIVIGAGEAGAVLANRAVAAGHRVAMLYQPPYGSTCLNTGCVPSKFMIHRARVAHIARTADRYHVRAGPVDVDLSSIVDQKNATLEHHREESLRHAREASRLTLIEGEARFVSPREVAAAGRTLESDRIFIATGMRPQVPPIKGLSDVQYLTSTSLMELREIPRHLVCIGGGYVACELGQAFRRFGADVTIVQSAPRLLPAEEPDVSTVLADVFETEGIRVIAGHRAVRVSSRGPDSGVSVIVVSNDDHELTIDGSHVLVASGRRPNTDMLDLEKAGVTADDKGHVRVNEYLETTTRGIWAIGDVNGQQPFTRICQEEAKVAFANAFENARLEMPRGFLGHAVFTDPSIGSVGLTEARARDAGHDVAVGLVTFDRVEKAQILGETAGFMKYVVDRGTRRLLGCHVIGPDAAELVYNAIVVMRHQGTIDELALAVGVFPTLQEGMEGTARGLLRKLAAERVAGPLVSPEVTEAPRKARAVA
ncbi:MAG: dihydrolipoyl dehydrogenase family protein [Gemmatimonadaceae bacterium]